MKHLGNPISIFYFLFVLLILQARSTTSQEVEDESEFDYAEGSGKGPDQWGKIHKEWADCSKGDMQSPIDISNRWVKVVPELGRLKTSYKPSNSTLKNRGHDIALTWVGDAGSIQINGTDYVLQQCHWHSPSEHTINGKRYALELHMVHQSSNLSVANRIAVVAILYKIGQPDTFLSKLTEGLKSLAGGRKEITMGMVDPSLVKTGGIKHYRYMGSLTTPPCTEGVIWTVYERVITVSRKQVDLLRNAVHDHAENNTRPLQPLNGRVIQLYEPKN